jgi:hypothetical protein
MNLAIRGIDANLYQHQADSFHSDQHKDLYAQFAKADQLEAMIKKNLEVLGYGE